MEQMSLKMEMMIVRDDALSRLTDDESLVWDALSTSHRGRSEAITRASLSTVVGMPARRLNTVVKSLVQVHGLPIGSSPHHPPGYYVIETPEESAEVTARYYRQALSLLYRMRRLKEVSLRDLCGQIEMDLRAYRD